MSASPDPSPSRSPVGTVIIEPTRGLLRVPWRELWEYRDLFRQFVRRDFAAKYRQTMLGPLWFILQPLMMTAVFTVMWLRYGTLTGFAAQLHTDSFASRPCGLLWFGFKLD